MTIHREITILWHEIAMTPPPLGRELLISDGGSFGVANAEQMGEGIWWNGAGFSGYEWKWDFTPTHWAEMTIPLPKRRKAVKPKQEETP